MTYHITASSAAKNDAELHIKESNIGFGTTPTTNDVLPNPAEMFLGAFAACMLKNVERFSEMMSFTFSKATVDINAKRLEKPPRMDNIEYILTIYSNYKKLNT